MLHHIRLVLILILALALAWAGMIPLDEFACGIRNGGAFASTLFEHCQFLGVASFMYGLAVFVDLARSNINRIVAYPTEMNGVRSGHSDAPDASSEKHSLSGQAVWC